MGHTYYKHGATAQGKDDDPFGTILQVGPRLLHDGKDTSRFHTVLGSSITTFDVGRLCSWKMAMAFLLMTRFQFSALTVLWPLWWVESYWNTQTRYLRSTKGSLMATASTLLERQLPLATKGSPGK